MEAIPMKCLSLRLPLDVWMVYNAVCARMPCVEQDLTFGVCVCVCVFVCVWSVVCETVSGYGSECYTSG